ncbi:RyR domain-containing protein [uncultured Thiohalocapsa sp.]|uniref:RyR domain-containing protein n=1 Tax=uncultured Thiohalocapsa sp. TaxID=768990 RepID=UPI0025EFC7BA|nr:RyR domain-containing protein [uncultured Thiohalocapsa sp.]
MTGALMGAPLVLVDGVGPLLERARSVLAADGVRVRRHRPGAGIPRGAAALLVDARDLAQRLAALSVQTRGRGRPLRVVVLAEAGGASAQTEDAGAPGAVSALPGDALRVEWIDPHRTAARVLLARWPLHRSMDPPAGQVPHLLIAGFGPVAQALFVHALRVGQYGGAPPVVTVAAAAADAWRDWIDARHPQAARCGQLRCTSLPSADLAEAPSVTMIAVCDMAADSALALARELLAQAAEQGASPPALLAVEADWRRGRLPDWDGQLVPVQPLQLAFSRQVLLEGRDDALAEVIHEHYRDTSAAQGRDPAAAPSGVAWTQLATSYRDANRHQADHLWAKLAVTDCQAVPEELVESFAFAPMEVEQLAVIEHRRWAVERWLDGWTYGAERDNARKRHPQLISYAELSDAMQDLDRFAVRLVPALLARSGLGVVRRLIVGVQGGDLRRPEAASQRAVRRVLRQLRARWPDRGLTLALDPTDARARLVAAEAVARHGAQLFLLLTAPLPALLAAQPAAARPEMLRLLAQAQRRIQLAGETGLGNWLARRAEILFALDERLLAGPQADRPPAKRVVLDAGGDARWNFAY